MMRLFLTFNLTAVLALATVTFPSPAAFGQEAGAGGWVWSRYFLGEGKAVVVDASGVYVGVGSSRLANGTFVESRIIKYEPEGRATWTRALGDVVGELKLAKNATIVYMLGRTSLHAVDEDGIPLWSFSFDTITRREEFDVAADASGVYVLRQIVEPVEGGVSIEIPSVQKYDPHGHEMWNRTLDAPEPDGVSRVALDASGVYVVGRVENTGGIWKLDLDGRYAWARQFNAGGGEDALSVAALDSGVYVAGTTQEALPNQMSSGADDAFLRKFNGSNGNELWTRQFGAPGIFGTASSESAGAVGVTEQGVYVSGTAIIPSADGRSVRSEPFIQKFNASGADFWGLRYRGASGARAMAAGDTGIFVAGIEARRSVDGTGFLGRFGETPTPPRDPQASPGEAHVSLAWTSPHFDGGVSITGYRIYRGTDPTSLELTGTIEGAATRSYLDRSVMNLVTYYYAVSAVNEIGEGPWSQIVEATPGTPPVVATPAPPPPDFLLFGFLAVLGAASAFAVYRLRGIRSPNKGPPLPERDPQPS